MMRCTREKKLCFNIMQIQYKVSSMDYMGHVVSESGLKPDPSKVEAIIQMPTPNIGGGIMSKKNWSQTFMGGGCTVTLTGPWTNTKNDRKARKIRLNSCLLIFNKTETFFIGIIKFLAPKTYV